MISPEDLHRFNMRPIALFRTHGLDTLEIAQLLGIHESKVVASIHYERTRLIYKASAREAARKNRPVKSSKLIKYAGHPG